MARPSKYDPKFCKQLIDFFDVEPYEDKELPHYGKEGKLKWKDFKRVANRLPTIRNFAKHIKISVATVYNWLNPEHSSHQPKFLDAFNTTKDLQKWFLIENGLNGCYNPLFAKFVAINISDMRDKQAVEATVDGTLTVKVVKYGNHDTK